MDRTQLAALYRAMFVAREIDRRERQSAQRGEAFFHVSGSGHEGTAVFALHLTPDDWLNCHYRDRALMLLRGVRPQAFFDNLLANDASHSRGRNMPGFHADRELHLMCMATLVGNSALHCCGVAEAVKEQASQPIVLCNLGDGGTQQGEFLEGVAEAVRRRLPVLFVIEDNRWAISTATAGQTFYSLPEGEAASFMGLPIHRIDGRDPVAASAAAREIVEGMRQVREPALIVFSVERLDSHTNADDQTLYRDESELARVAATGDPIRNLEASMLKQGFTAATIERIRQEAREETERAEEAAWHERQPEPVFTAKAPISVELTHPSRERRGDDEDGPKLTMREALRDVLRHHLQIDGRVSLLGQDIEDPKGDVFGVTRGLSTEFPERVRNAPLAESTILGSSIGRALAGERPVAFMQFADFMPVAFNQITSELGNIYWRTAGEWQCPVIMMVACGAYRPGLGPFHGQTMEAIAAHTTGIDIVMPSSAADAAGLLHAAFRSGRPTIFFYPKTLLNDPQQTTSADVERQFVPLGVARKRRAGRDITFVGWGNTIRVCEQAAAALETAGIESEVLDLRSLSPWDEQAVLSSVEKTARLVVVHEDNQTCGFGAEVLATVAEKTRVPVAMRRVTKPDVPVPYQFANQMLLLPSVERVLTVAAELLHLDLSFVDPPAQPEGSSIVPAIGSGPADETVVIAELACKLGQSVARGDTLASLEATKSVFELTSPVTGRIEEIFHGEGDVVAVGKPLFKITTDASVVKRKPALPPPMGQPVFSRRPPLNIVELPRRSAQRRSFDVGLSAVATGTGSRLVTNEELVAGRPGHKAEDIIQLTGIERRHWADRNENAVSLAVSACRKVLDRERLLLDDIDLVICSTTSPTVVSPSMACQVLGALADGRGRGLAQAFDISAACSGYLYALQSAYDYLQSQPQGRVLVVTTEVLSPLLDMNDFDTSILFGDAASATLVYGEEHFDRAKARLFRPDLSAKGEDGSTLMVPLRDNGFIQMKGRKVFSEAVRAMVSSLTRACERQGMNVGELDMVVPHQANQRIIEAVQARIAPPVFSNIRYHGNTSSTSIPLCLEDILPRMQADKRLGLCAFGGGFTFGAALLQSL